MNELSNLLFSIIKETDLNQKIAKAKTLADLEAEAIAPHADVLDLKHPGRPEDFKVEDARQLGKRGFSDLKARATFLHAIANIELLAIELPALCLLRFGSDDLKYIKRQMAIIAEEAKHFSMLKDRLEVMDCEFGSLPVHNGLWDFAWRCENEIEHQIVIPCYLEARGLDVCPEFVKKFDNIGDEASSKIIQIILRDEIGHVKAGLDYLQDKSKELGVSSDELFTKTLSRFFDDKLKSKHRLNLHARREAGFSEKKLRSLQ